MINEEDFDNMEEMMDAHLNKYLSQFPDRKIGLNKIKEDGELEDFRIMGLDLSLTETGISIFSRSMNKIEVMSIPITTKMKRELEITTQLEQIAYIVDQILNELNVNVPTLVVIEDTFFNPRNAKVAKVLAQLGGIVRYTLFISGFEFIDVEPCKLKKFICGEGKGNASKEEVIEAVNKRLGCNITNNNKADAVALAVFGLNSLNMEIKV